jgi:hypothetical protein
MLPSPSATLPSQSSVLPSPPSLPGALRLAAIDLYEQGPRLAAANLLWSGVLLALWLTLDLWPPAAVLLSPVLGLPVLVIFRLSAVAARGSTPTFADAAAVLRRLGPAALGIAASALLVAAAGLVNLVTGLALGTPLGWALATVAAWTLLATATLLLAGWPILADPARQETPARMRLRLAALLVLAHPARLATLAALEGAIFAVSTVFFALLVTVGVAYGALVAARAVLPAADRLEVRLTGRLPPGLVVDASDEPREKP